MNERMVEIANKARAYAESKPDIYQVAYDKKFAELIIEECYLYITGEFGLFWDDGIRKTKKHFGVEE